MYLSITQLENNDTIITSIRVLNDMTLRGVRLGMFKSGSPNGTLTLVLKEGSTTVSTSVVLLSAINAYVGTYFHGYVLFELPSNGVVFRKNNNETYKTLTLELTLSGHTDGASYISWVRSTPATEIVDSFGEITNDDLLDATQLLHHQPYKIELYAI